MRQTDDQRKKQRTQHWFLLSTSAIMCCAVVFPLFLSVCVAQTAFFLSSVGDDAKDCKTPTTACRSLSRGVVAAKLSTGLAKVLSIGAGTFAMELVTIDFPLTLRGAGRSQTALSCPPSAAPGTITIGNAGSSTVRFEALSIDGCIQPLELAGKYTAERRVELADVHLRNCDGGLFCTAGHNTLLVVDSQISPAAVMAPRAQILMSSDCDRLDVELRGDTRIEAVHATNAGALIDLSVSSFYERSLTVGPGVTFGNASRVAGPQLAWIAVNDGKLRINSTDFYNGDSLAAAVTVSDGANVVIADSRFVGARKTSALLIVGITAAVLVVDSVFEDNESAFGSAIRLLSGNLTVRSTSFVGNRAVGANGTSGSGGAIVCDNGNLTVVDSTFTNNVARGHRELRALRDEFQRQYGGVKYGNDCHQFVRHSDDARETDSESDAAPDTTAADEESDHESIAAAATRSYSFQHRRRNRANRGQNCAYHDCHWRVSLGDGGADLSF
jgi:hypothetical protein